jgi:hypothetical protein
MASTSAFGWETPDDTDLVKDGAAAIRTLGNSIDTSMSELKGGTTGQVLSKTSNTDMDFTWVAQDDSNAIQNAIVTTKGDLIVATGNATVVRQAVGSNGQVLTADSTQADGVIWATPAASSGPAFLVGRSTSQNITPATFTKIQFNSEVFDTDNCFDSTTNYRFTPNKSGYYQMNMSVLTSGAPATRSIVEFWKNGSLYLRFSDLNTVNIGNSGSTLMFFNGTTDYAEGYAYIAGTPNTDINGTGTNTQFSGVWIRS